MWCRYWCCRNGVRGRRPGSGFPHPASRSWMAGRGHGIVSAALMASVSQPVIPLGTSHGGAVAMTAAALVLEPVRSLIPGGPGKPVVGALESGWLRSLPVSPMARPIFLLGGVLEIAHDLDCDGSMAIAVAFGRQLSKATPLRCEFPAFSTGSMSSESVEQ